MKLGRISTGLPVLNLRVGAIAPDQGSAYGKGRGGRPWRRLREKVMQRDGFRCQACKRKDQLSLATEVDHRIPIFEGGSDAMENLEAICSECHLLKSQEEAKRARKASHEA